MKSKLIPFLFLFNILILNISFAEARLEKGTKELGVQGNLDLDATDDYLLNLDITYGYFIRDNLEVGVVTSINASDNYKNFNLGAFTEYNFNNSSNWVPYVGASAQVGRADFSGDLEDSNVDFEDATALNVKLALGVKYFINDNVAITTEINHNIATDDINFDGDEVKDSATNILIGTRFYF